MNPIADGLERIRTKYPQAHALPSKHGAHLVIVPSVLLPKGWNKTICTALFLAPAGFPAACPENFWIDLPDLWLDPTQTDRHDTSDGRGFMSVVHPRYTNRSNPIPGFPEWSVFTWFKWRLQSWDPNRDTLFTFLMAIRMRLNPAR